MRYIHEFILVVAFILFSLAIIMRPLPINVLSGDVAQAYTYTLLISENPDNIFYNEYPKLFHILSALAGAPFGDIGTGMYIVSIIASLVVVLSIFRIALAITGNKDISLFSAVFSMSIMPLGTGANIGLFWPIPQTLGIMFFCLAALLLVEKRFLLAGVMAGFHYLSHNSWPISFATILAFIVADLCMRGKEGVGRGLFSGILGFLAVFVPVYTAFLYYTKHWFWTQFSRDVDVMVSAVSFPLSIFPPFVFLAGIYGMIKSIVKPSVGTLFLAIVFIMVIIGSQLYLIDIPGLVLGQKITPYKILPFFVLPISIFSSIAVFSLVKQNFQRTSILILIVLVSAAFFHSTVSTFNKTLDKNDTGMLEGLKEIGIRDSTIIYYSAEVYDSERYITVMSGNKEARYENYAYRYLNKTKEVIGNHFFLTKTDNVIGSDYKEVLKNDKYTLYNYTGITTQEDVYSLSDMASVYAGYLNDHGKVRLGNSSFSIMFLENGGDSICIVYDGKFVSGKCNNATIEISGKRENLRQIFTMMYGLRDLGKRAELMLASGELEMKINGRTELYGVKIPFVAGKKFYLTDLGTTLSIGKDYIIMEPGKEGIPVKYRSILGLVKFVNFQTEFSYPNIVFGLPFLFL